MSDAKKLKIKRCPFCGSKAHVTSYVGTFCDLYASVYTVVCNDDNCRGGLGYVDLRNGRCTEGLAIELWNRRK